MLLINSTPMVGSYLAVLLSSMIGSTVSEPEGDIPHWIKPNPINILMVDSPPYFGTNLPPKVVKRLGDTAFLKCKVFNLGNNMVSWIRTDPLEIISSGLYTFIGDSRYSTEYLSEDNVWVLRITNVRYEDSATFECQVNTNPVMSYNVSLKVTKPSAGYFVNDAPQYLPERRVQVLGGRHQLIKAGIAHNLTCVVNNPPPGNRREVNWIHDDRIIIPRAGVSVLSEKSPDMIISSLIFQPIKIRHAGRYRCDPGSYGHDLVVLDVIKEESTEKGIIPKDMVMPIFSFMVFSVILLILGIIAVVARRCQESESCTNNNIHI